MVHTVIEQVLERICDRSKDLRSAYLEQCEEASLTTPYRNQLSCTNLAHSYAASTSKEKELLRQTQASPNLAIVTAYNDMLSAHQPYYRYPEKLKKYALEIGATAQVAGGTPAMCDGVTQGQPGMELSLYSRDVIALSTAIALSHNTFDGGLYLGICDKIVPGLLMGALSFGHLPGIFVPSGPMRSGVSNESKANVRVQYAEGKVGKDELLKSEEGSYHSEGTCTFYGTANSNQMLLEVMGLQLPGSAFVSPNSELRDALTKQAVHNCTQACLKNQTGLGYIMDAKNIVNGVIGLLATGGSTNHTLHLVAIAKACGWLLHWEDIAELSEVIPLITKLYPNGAADVNQFHLCGGTPSVINKLTEQHLIFTDIQTAYGLPFQKATKFPESSDQNKINWVDSNTVAKDNNVLRSADDPFQKSGGLSLLSGNVGKAIIKTSSLPEKLGRSLTAPAIVFQSQEEILSRFKNGELNKDFVAVLPWQGPASNGMPELHKLTPPLTSLQNQGYKIALITDGRMSGASGKFPAAIHLTPEAKSDGMIAKIKDGDSITLNWEKSQLTINIDEKELQTRIPSNPPSSATTFGRSLFSQIKSQVSPANQGASFII